MPRIGGLLEKVVRVHGAGRPDLELVERTFASLRLELEEHIDEEELVLFPACRALEQDTGAVDRGLIDRHRTEHEAVGRKLLALRELAGGYELSQAIIPFVQASYARSIYDEHKDSLGYVRDAQIYELRTGIEGDFGENGVIVVSVRRTYSVESDLRFEIAERPAIGSVRVLQLLGDGPELLHLAANREAAERWLANNRYNRAYLEEVSADEVGADVIEGRTAA